MLFELDLIQIKKYKKVLYMDKHFWMNNINSR